MHLQATAFLENATAILDTSGASITMNVGIQTMLLTTATAIIMNVWMTQSATESVMVIVNASRARFGLQAVKNAESIMMEATAQLR